MLRQRSLRSLVVNSACVLAKRSRFEYAAQDLRIGGELAYANQTVKEAYTPGGKPLCLHQAYT
jgi:hypothetical protein